MRVKRSSHDIPQYGHGRNSGHDPQVEPCTLNSELDERGEEDRKRRYPFHDAGPDSEDPSYATRILLDILIFALLLPSAAESLVKLN